MNAHVHSNIIYGNIYSSEICTFWKLTASLKKKLFLINRQPMNHSLNTCKEMRIQLLSWIYQTSNNQTSNRMDLCFSSFYIIQKFSLVIQCVDSWMICSDQTWRCDKFSWQWCLERKGGKKGAPRSKKTWPKIGGVSHRTFVTPPPPLLYQYIGLIHKMSWLYDCLVSWPLRSCSVCLLKISKFLRVGVKSPID